MPQHAIQTIVPIYFYMLMTETHKFIDLGTEVLGAKNEALKDIYQLCIKGNPN